MLAPLSAACSLFCNAGPLKRFPVAAARDILKDVLTSYLQEEKYEVEWSQKMTKTLCEVSESQKLCRAADLNTFKSVPSPQLSGDQSRHEGPADSQIQNCCPGAHRPAEWTEHAGQQPLSVGRGQ